MRADTRDDVVRSAQPAPRVAVLTNVVPTYRRGFYDRLFARQDVAVTVYCQPAIAGTNVQSIHARYPREVRLVESIALKGEALAWQFTPWRELLGYDVVFVAPRFEGGKLASPARLTVFHNGVLVHHDAVLTGPVAHAAVRAYEPHSPQGPLGLQDHGNPVRFRNIWVRPLGASP